MSLGARPSGLPSPLGTDERAKAMRDLLEMDAQLQLMASLTDSPRERWPAGIEEMLPATPLASEDAAEVLRRWKRLFRDEIELVHNTRNRLVHQVKVTDSELLNALTLAQQLLELTLRRH